MVVIRYSLISTLLLCALCVKSQIPATEIYLLDIDNHGSHAHVGKPKNISNSKGYDSQPCFSKEGGTLLFTSIRDGQKQADIYEYQVVADQLIQATETPESEYSPTFMDDGIHFSTVRVEKDSAQRLWQFKFHSTDKPTRILDKTIDSVGYHCWYTQEKLALFILTEPISLQLAEKGNWETKKIADNIGRCMQKSPSEEAFYFVDKSDSTAYYICKYSNGLIEKIVATLSGSEDFCLTPNGNFIMAKDGIIYQLDTRDTNLWKPLANLSAEGITGITRIAISPAGNRLAVVAKEKE